MKHILDWKQHGRISALIVLGFCVVAWWPLAFWPANRVTWLEDRPGIQIKQDGVLHDPEWLIEPRPWISLASANFTIELWLEADALATHDVGHILSIHDGRFPSRIVLCQWQDELILRYANQRFGGSVREVGEAEALVPGKANFITVTVGDAGTAFYVEGKVRGRHLGSIQNDAPVGKLVLGNAVSGRRPWNGKLYGLAIYDRPLAAEEVAEHHAQWKQQQARQLTNDHSLVALYLFDEGQGRVARDSSRHAHQLQIPAVYRAPYKKFLAAPGNQFDFGDIMVNVLGFVPFGFSFFLFCAASNKLRTWINVGIVVLMATLISLLLETGQMLLGNRDSALLDVICNGLGGWFGALLANSLALCRSENSATNEEGLAK